MKLAPQEIEIPLNTGQNSKASVELQAPDTLAAVTNLRWNRLGELEKRPRYFSNASATVPAGGRYHSVNTEALFSREHEVFGLTDNYGLVSADPANSTATINNQASWMPRACLVSRRTVERAQYNSDHYAIRHATIAPSGNAIVLAWITSATPTTGQQPVDARLYMKAIDSVSGQLLAPVQEVFLNGFSGTTNYVRAVPYTGPGAPGVLVAFTTGTSGPFVIQTRLYDSATRAFSVGPDLATDARYAQFALVKARDGDEYYLSYVDNAADVIKARYGTTAQIAGGTGLTHTSTILEPRGSCIVQGATRTLIAYYTETHNVHAEPFGSPGQVATILPAEVDEELWGITGAQENDADEAVIWVEVLDTDTVLNGGLFSKVRAGHVSFTSGAPTRLGEDQIPFTQIAGGGFTLERRAYVAVYLRRDPMFAPTSVILARFNKTPANKYRHDLVARLCHDRFSSWEGVNSAHGEPLVDVVGNEVRYAFTGDPQPAAGPQALFLSTVTFAPRREPVPGAYVRSSLPLPYAEHARSTYVASGDLLQHDGDRLVEAAAVTAPVLHIDATTSGPITYTGAVSLVAIYRYVDAQGNLHESGPSNVVTVGPVSAVNVRATISFPAFTSYEFSNNIMALEPELYATENGGSTFYLVCQTDGKKRTVSGTDSHFVWWTMTNIPAGQPANRQLRALGASGGEIPPEPPPAFRSIAVVGDRMWGVDAEDTSRIWFTKPFAAGYPPEWSTFCTLVIGDDCVAVADVAGIPTVLGANGSYQIYGTGPDALGNGTFEPARLLHDTGCIDPLVCNTPLGLFFRGRRGYYVLAGQLSPIGLPIDPMSYRLGPIDRRERARVVFDEIHNEIRALNGNGGRYFVYNLLEQKWSEWAQSATAQDCVDAVVSEGFVHTLQWDGQACAVRREAVDNFSTEGWAVTTAWLKLDGVGGAVRLWRVWACLANVSDIADVQTLTLTHQVDFRVANVQTWSWTGAELAALSSGATGLQLAVQPATQVARAARFSLSVTMTAESAGPKPLALRLAYGVRPGQGKRTRPDVK